MFGWDADFGVALGADDALAELALDATLSIPFEAGAKAEEANLLAFDLLFDLHSDGKSLEFGFGHDRTDVHDFLERQGESVAAVLRTIGDSGGRLLLLEFDVHRIGPFGERFVGHCVARIKWIDGGGCCGCVVVRGRLG